MSQNDEALRALLGAPVRRVEVLHDGMIIFEMANEAIACVEGEKVREFLMASAEIHPPSEESPTISLEDANRRVYAAHPLREGPLPKLR